MKKKATYRSRKQFFSNFKITNKPLTIVSTTEQNSSFLVETIRTCNRKTEVAVQASGDAIVCPMVNLVVTIRPRLTTVTSLHHHGMSLTSSTLLVVILCHITQPRHACSFSSRAAVAVARKLLCA